MPDLANMPTDGMSRREPLLHSIHVENLRSLSGPHEIPLAPLTLIYGPNAAGKSTVLRAIRHLQSWMSLINRSLIEEEEWERILEEHRRLIYAHDTTRTLRLGMTYSTAARPGERRELTLTLTESQHRPDEMRLNMRSAGPPDDAQWLFVSSDQSEVLPELFRAPTYRFLPEPDEALEELDAEVRRLLRRTFFLGPHRGEPRGRYAYRDSDVIPWYLRAASMDDDRLNAWLTRLDVPYTVRPVSHQEANPGGAEDMISLANTADYAVGEEVPPTGLHHWELRDTRSNVEVKLDDVGYGVGQLLPIVDYCVRDTQQVICIEQPELHLHPRLQSNLGDLFVDSVRRGNQVIAETHSKNILLRVRRLIREGQIASDSVAVVYVDNTPEEGASIQMIRLGEQGEQLDPWPSGFFDDSLSDILGITR